MQVSRIFLKVADTLVDFIILFVLCIAGLYAVYALWDNGQIYTMAENVQADMIKLKPVEEGSEGASFEELLAINKDVCAWITLDNTNVDYPVLQGESNLTYINTDVYGNFSLAGSIFLDTRCNKNFSDNYSLLYGHHMAENNMFGDLDLYKDEKFFKENKTGKLILSDRIYDLEIFSCLIVSSSENAIFDPYNWQDDIDGLLSFAKQNSLYIREDVVDRLMKSEDQVQILAMSTCATEFTNARTIIMTVMEPHKSVE